MSLYNNFVLRPMRKAAGLGAPVRRRDVVSYIVPLDNAPMPSMYMPGAREKWEEEDNYINPKYFSPAALRWADAVVEYLVDDRRLPSDDMECLARVWGSLRRGKKASAAQLKGHKLALEYDAAERTMGSLEDREWRKRGLTPGDDELPHDADLPTKVRLFKDLMMSVHGMSDDGVDKWLARRRKARDWVRGTH